MRVPIQKRLIVLPGDVKSAIILTVLILSLISSAEAALLCSYRGPHVSNDYLEISDFEVTGPEPLRVGDTVTVTFTLKAIEVPVQFGDHGVFVAARDPDGVDRGFGRDIGYLYEDYWLPADKSIDFKASTTVDKEGGWIFLPAYSSRTDEGDIVHTTCMVESDYANHEIGEYLAVRHFGTEYMAINGKPNVLSPILMEMDEDEKHTMVTGEGWDLGGGYSLVAEQIDLEGGKIWLSIQRDGEELKSSVIELQKSGDRFYNRRSLTGFPMAYDVTTEDVSTTSTFVYQGDMGHEGDMPIFSVYVDTMFRGTDSNIVQLKYATLIGDLIIIDAEPDYVCYLDVVSPAQPDLTVEEISWDPAHPVINESVIVGVIVSNAGGASEETTLLLWGCCDLSRRVRPLNSGEATTIYFEPIIFEEPGEFEITATIDAASEITESNETNNERSEIITVEGVLPPLSVSIFTDPVPSGESNEVAVRVTADGDPVQDASISLLTTTGDLAPDAGSTDADGRFVSIFTAPAVHTETMYTIHAEAEIGGRAGDGSASDLITVPLEIPPTAHIEIHYNPAEEGGGITIEGWGEDEDGEVVECRWTFPDGTTISDHGDSSELTLEPEEVVAGWYAFAVRGDRGMWSEAAEFELPAPPRDDEAITQIQTNFSRFSEYISEHISDPAVLAAMIAVLAAGALLLLRPPPHPKPDSDPKKKKKKEDEDKHGSIHATSDPTDAIVFVDGAYKGRSPKTIDNVLIGPHTVLFLKRGYFGYEKNAVVIANQTTPIHRDLTKIPEVKLKLSADPAEIVADGKSESTIEIEIVTKDDNEIPIPVLEDTMVVLETDIGTIKSPVKIPATCASVTSTLVSPTSSGTATAKAEAEYEKIVKLKGSTTVEFLDAESE